MVKLERRGLRTFKRVRQRKRKTVSSFRFKREKTEEGWQPVMEGLKMEFMDE